MHIHVHVHLSYTYQTMLLQYWAKVMWLQAIFVCNSIHVYSVHIHHATLKNVHAHYNYMHDEYAFKRLVRRPAPVDESTQ